MEASPETIADVQAKKAAADKAMAEYDAAKERLEAEQCMSTDETVALLRAEVAELKKRIEELEARPIITAEPLKEIEDDIGSSIYISTKDPHIDVRWSTEEPDWKVVTPIECSLEERFGDNSRMCGNVACRISRSSELPGILAIEFKPPFSGQRPDCMKLKLGMAAAGISMQHHGTPLIRPQQPSLAGKPTEIMTAVGG